jgi:hypothetical protein
LYIGSVFCCHLQPKTGRLAVTGAEDDMAYIWETHSGEIVLQCKGHKVCIQCNEVCHLNKQKDSRFSMSLYLYKKLNFVVSWFQLVLQVQILVWRLTVLTKVLLAFTQFLEENSRTLL